MGYSGGLSSALSAFTEILTIVFIFASLLVLAPWVALAAAAYFGLAAFVVQRVIRPRIQAAGQKARAASEEVSRASLQPLTAVKEIKLRRAHDPFVQAFRQASTRGAEAEVTTSLLNDLPKYFLEIIFVLGVGVLAVVATTGASAVEGLVLLGLFVAAGTRILPSSVSLISALSGVRFARSPLEHLVGVHRADASEPVRGDRPRRHRRSARGRYRDPRTSASPMATRPRSKYCAGSTSTSRRGSSLAVVGSSGAGKSTMVDILLGLQHPTGGVVTAGGISIFDNLPAWQRHLAVVPQEVTLLDATIGENIAFDEEVDDAQARGSGPAGAAARPGPRAARRTRHDRRRTWLAAVGRSAPAHRHRACPLPEPLAPRARRGDLRVGQRDRAAHHRHHREPARRRHGRGRRPPALDGSALRPLGLHGDRAGHRIRHLRRGPRRERFVRTWSSWGLSTRSSLCSDAVRPQNAGPANTRHGFLGRGTGTRLDGILVGRPTATPVRAPQSSSFDGLIGSPSFASWVTASGRPPSRPVREKGGPLARDPKHPRSSPTWRTTSAGRPSQSHTSCVVACELFSWAGRSRS